MNGVNKFLSSPAGQYAVLGVLGLAAAYLIWKTIGKEAAGAVFGSSTLQRSSNADGSEQTAYDGHGLIGTLGAGVNNATGGYLSEFGEWIGGKVYDVTH